MALVDLQVGRWIMSCPPRHAMSRAVNLLGGPEFTKRDMTRCLLGYADLTSADGRVIAPGPLARPEGWRKSFAFKLALALRGVL